MFPQGGGISNTPLTTEAPTCSISFTPTTITLGQTVTSSLKTTGFITEASEKQTGFFPFESNSNTTIANDGNTYFFNQLNSGKIYSTKIKPSIAGEAFETYIVTGQGGSSSCTASIKIIPAGTQPSQ